MTQNAHLANHWVFSLHFFAMMFFNQNNTNTPKIMYFGAVGDLVWRFGCEK